MQFDKTLMALLGRAHQAVQVTAGLHELRAYCWHVARLSGDRAYADAWYGSALTESMGAWFASMCDGDNVLLDENDTNTVLYRLWAISKRANFGLREYATLRRVQLVSFAGALTNGAKPPEIVHTAPIWRVHGMPGTQPIKVAEWAWQSGRKQCVV